MDDCFYYKYYRGRSKGVAIPQSYGDLIKAEYKGLIVMPNPASSGTGFLTVLAILQLKD